MPLVPWVRRVVLKRVAPNTLRRAAAWLAIVTLAVFVLLMGKPSYTNASRPPRFNADLAMQFARDAEDIGLILGDAPSPDREVMRVKLYIDYGFIASYSALFVTLGMLVARGPTPWRKIAGSASAVCGVATGVFDVLENRAIFAVLDVPLALTTPAMINAIRRPASAKWILVAATVALLSTCFLARRRVF